MVLHKSNINVKAFVESTVDIFYNTARGKNVTLKVPFTLVRLYVCADATSIVFLSLVWSTRWRCATLRCRCPRPSMRRI